MARGRLNPKEHGFDENDGPNSNGGPENVGEPNPKTGTGSHQARDRFHDPAGQGGKPFYLQISYRSCRSIDAALPETIEKVKQRLNDRIDAARIGTAAGNEDIDATIGKILDQIQSLGLGGNTYVFYSADHGAQGRGANGALTNGKGTVWEGGIRVPLLFAGTGNSNRSLCAYRASGVDLYPTVAELAGIPQAELPSELEGGSLLALPEKRRWTGGKETS